MKLTFITILAGFVLFIGFSKAQDFKNPGPNNPREESCLKERWQDIAYNKANREFDINNEFDRSGNSFSCSLNITPSELKAFYTALQKAVASDDKNAVADMIKYPLINRISIYGADGTSRNVKISLIADKAEFINYYDKIITPSAKKLIACSKLSEMSLMGSSGVGLGLGEIWMQTYYQSRKLALWSINISENDYTKWLNEHCTE